MTRLVRRACFVLAMVCLSGTACQLKRPDTIPVRMDAMAETPPARRRVTITTEVRGGVVDVSVHDAGTGLPAQIDGTLFTPFVTTKARGIGIGLTITQTIVETHGGTINARNNPEGGATFTVTLRRVEAPRILSGPPSAG